jgi:PAS domain S-box-containing protein
VYNQLKSAIKINEFDENIFNTVRGPLLVLDKDLRVINANHSFYNFFKVSPSQTIGTLVYDLGNKQWDIAKLKDLLEKILPEKTTFDNYEVEHDFTGIGNRILCLNARQIKRAFGEEKIILLAIEDITEQKHIQTSLSETSRMTNEYLNILVNHAHVPIIVWNASFVITRFNHCFEELSGYNISEVIGKKIDFLFPIDKIDSTLELFKNNLDKEKFEINEIDILRKDKEVRTVLWNSANILDKEGKIIITTIAQDITKLKRSKEALSSLETRYRRLFESAKDGILILDAETGKIIDVNPYLIELLGYSYEKLVEKTIWEIGFFKDIAANEDKFFELQQKEYVRYEDLPLETFDGRKINVEFVSNVYLVNNHKVIQCNIRDITKRIRIEEALHSSNQITEDIINSMPVRVFWKDKNLVYLGCNKLFALDSGFNDPTEIIGKDDFQMGWYNQAELYREDDRVVMETGRSKLLIEEPQTTSEGNEITLLTSKIPLHNSAGEIVGVLGTYIDITERKQAEEEITMLAHALRSVKECVSITDLNDKILFVNKSFLDTYGYKENELIGKQVTDVLRSNKNALEYVQEILPATIRGEWKGELLNKRKDGSEFPVYLSTSIINDKNGKPLGLIGVASDITEHKNMLDDLHKLSIAVEQSPASILITDIKGNIEYANPKVTETTGYQLSELLGKNPKIFGTGEKSAYDYKTLWDTIGSGNEWRGEFHNKRKNGELYWESASISAIKNNLGEIINYLAVKEDITEKKRLNDELISSKEKAEEMNKLKSNFLANMSHELRTPLVGILGYADILRSSVDSMELKEMAETIFNSGSRLSETLNLILDLSRFESEKKNISFQKVDLVNRTNETITLFRQTAKKKGLSLISIYSPASIVINFDERAYNSILNNLINNAIKFTSEGSITINVSQIGNSVEIKVIDTGIGISQKDCISIFDEFRQVSEGYNRNFEGSGLGLSITKKLVEKYGGTISVESEVGKGSTFKVILPVTSVVENVKEPGVSETQILIKSPESILAKPLGLLVDDDPLVFLVMNRYLRDYVELETTVDAEFAAKMLRKKKYDIIFMDINLRRGMDGKKATMMIRKMEGYEITPIIATTAYAMAGDKEEFILAGCSHYLSKPFGKTEIINVVKKALKQ